MSAISNKTPHPPPTIKINNFALATTLAAIAVIAATPCPSFVACDVKTRQATGFPHQRPHFPQDIRATGNARLHAGLEFGSLSLELRPSHQGWQSKTRMEMLRCMHSSALRFQTAVRTAYHQHCHSRHTAPQRLLALRGGFPSGSERSTSITAAASADTAPHRTLTVSTFNVWCPLFKRISGKSQRESVCPELYLPRQRAIIDLLEEVLIAPPLPPIATRLASLPHPFPYAHRL
jgi:hypothetical protein